MSHDGPTTRTGTALSRVRLLRDSCINLCTKAMDETEWVGTEFTPGPEPLQHPEPDPAFVRRPLGFVWPDPEPLTWEGDNA